MIRLTKFGEKLCRESALYEMMDDLGAGSDAGHPRVAMLGGGNPAAIPGIEAVWRTRMQEIMDDGERFERMLGAYDSPQGNREFLEILAEYFNRECGWNLTYRNIVITNGSQNAFFFLFNMLAGECPDGIKRRVLFPLCPEYIGYADQGLEPDLFTARLPLVRETGPHAFRYEPDFAGLNIGDDIGLVCLSRPTNPTGLVLSRAEVARLDRMAAARGIPLLVDAAYGAPFPGIVFADGGIDWSDNLILTWSLSKIGLPAVRTGIVVASEEMIHKLATVNAVISLATSGIGQTLVAPLFADGRITQMADQTVRPFYRKKRDEFVLELERAFGNAGVDWRLHECEGGFFVWLWFPRLAESATAVYRAAKERGVFVTPGEAFFTGPDQAELAAWPHHRQCLRLNYADTGGDIPRGLAILAEEIDRRQG